MQPTHNTLAEDIRAQSIESLNRHLAAAIDLHAQVKQAHWNVRGPNFIALHALFDKVSKQIAAFADQLAERASGLGGAAQGTIQVAAARSFLVPYEHGIADGKQHGFAVASSLAAFGQSIRVAIGEAAAIGDPTTADLFTEISRGVDQQLWFVESHHSLQQAASAKDGQSPVAGRTNEARTVRREPVVSGRDQRRGPPSNPSRATVEN